MTRNLRYREDMRIERCHSDIALIDREHIITNESAYCNLTSSNVVDMTVILFQSISNTISLLTNCHLTSSNEM